MKYLVTSGWVTVTGPPLAICSLNNGITEPDEPSTLPNRTLEKIVPLFRECKSCNTSSARRLVAPMIFVGLTALSVETRMKRFTFASIAASASTLVPKTLFSTPANTLSSTIGTCL